MSDLKLQTKKVKSGFKISSIKTQLSLIIGALVLVIVAGLAVLSYWYSAKIVEKTVDDSLEYLAVQGGHVIDREINSYIKELSAIADNDEITTGNADELGNPTDDARKKEIMQEEIVRVGYKDMALVGTNG